MHVLLLVWVSYKYNGCISCHISEPVNTLNMQEFIFENRKIVNFPDSEAEDAAGASGSANATARKEDDEEEDSSSVS